MTMTRMMAHLKRILERLFPRVDYDEMFPVAVEIVPVPGSRPIIPWTRVEDGLPEGPR